MVCGRGTKGGLSCVANWGRSKLSIFIEVQGIPSWGFRKSHRRILCDLFFLGGREYSQDVPF